MVIESIASLGSIFWPFNHVVSRCLCCLMTQSSERPFLSAIMIASVHQCTVASVVYSVRHCNTPDSLLCNHGRWTLFYHWCPSQLAYPCVKNRVYQSLSILLDTLDSTRRLLQYCNPLSWSPLGMLDYARTDLEPTWTARRTTFHASSMGPVPMNHVNHEMWHYIKKRR